MVFQYFQQHDLFILFPSVACLVISILLYAFPRQDKDKLWPAMLFLILAALGLRIFMAHLDPFLWDWDERYHALVAKNFLKHPLIPTLYDHPAIPYDYKNWGGNHIWLHKQPMALWQMTLSFYLFGINQFTARFPMVFESVILVWIIYRIGTITINKQAGYLSAWLFTVSFYALDFTSGGQATDNVDFALLFYTSLAMWAWLEYRKEVNIKWVILVGIFAGLSVLTKWLTGLLVFGSWGIFILLNVHERKQLNSYIHFALAFIISMMIFVPWQWYAAAHYPSEYHYEMVYNTQHLFHAIEGHSDTNWYYLANLDHTFGFIVPYILPLAILILSRMIKRKDHKIFIFLFMIIPYIFFSLFVATKMPAYCYYACLPIFIGLGSFAWFVQQQIEKYKWKLSGYAITLILFVISWYSINLNSIAKIHTGFDSNNHYRINKVSFTDYFRKISKNVPKDYVIFGLPYNCEVEMMFYTGNTCYPFDPDLKDYQRLKNSGIKIAIILSSHTPSYLLNDPEVLKLSWL